MKKVLFGLFLVGFIGAGHSQILLKEAKVQYKGESMMLDPTLNSLTISIPEKSFGEFQNDPLMFVKKKFDVQKLIKDNEKENYKFYDVNFKCTNGLLVAHFDKKGELLSSFQKFRNVRLPEDARRQILEKYQNAVIIGNNYVATSKGWDIKKEHYKVKLKDGKKTRRVKVNSERGEHSLAGL